LSVERYAVTLRERIGAAASAIRARCSLVPSIGIVLGSGLGALAEEMEREIAVPYGDVPHFPVPGAEGHRGNLVLGRLEGREIAVLQGRCHLYEGYSADEVAFPVRVMAALGVRSMVVTNAAGGIHRAFRAGDLMLIADQINATGTSPLTGPNDDLAGPRFPDMTAAYHPELRALARRIAEQQGIPLHTGTYVGVRGPAYETPAEIEMLARWGADAVGMSTVLEVIAARHAGLSVLGLSAITNATRDAAPRGPLTHGAVLDVAASLGPRLIRLVRGIVREMPEG
jgi:purine-nucleoside phosphorylase